MYNRSDILSEIAQLYQQLKEKRRAYADAVRSDLPFEQLKALFVEIKELYKQQELCYEKYYTRLEAQ